MAKITVIQPTPTIQMKKRVCAYVRVSTDKAAMLHSLSAQVSYYNRLIQERPEWLFAGIYADKAKTGTLEESRSEFVRMLSDCRDGKIDVIITKSISRFARNTVTLLQVVRELKSLGIDIYFEEQRIHTLSPEGELLLTLLASVAQEESRAVSENQKWRVKHNFENGIPCDGTILGYRLKNGKYEIVPSEAETVKRIFSEYLSGKGYSAIAKDLNDDGIISRFDTQWYPSVVANILCNYTYTGNLILQKTFRESHITKRKCVNTGELPKYHAEQSHDAIIDISTFNAVQDERKHRAEMFKPKKKKSPSYPFTGLLVCDICGKHYKRRTTPTGITWVCSTYVSKGKKVCPSKQIPETILENAVCDVLGEKPLTQLKEVISCIRVCNGNRLVFCFKNGSTQEYEWTDRSRSLSWTNEMKEQARNHGKRRKQNV